MNSWNAPRVTVEIVSRCASTWSRELPSAKKHEVTEHNKHRASKEIKPDIPGSPESLLDLSVHSPQDHFGNRFPFCDHVRIPLVHLAAEHREQGTGQLEIPRNCLFFLVSW